KIQEREWFASIIPELAEAQNASIRRTMIDELQHSQPTIYSDFMRDKRTSEAESHFLRQTNRYPLGASGDTNTYSIFVELSLSLLAPTGFSGMIVKTGILADYSMRQFFSFLVNERHLVSAYDFSNRRLIFPAVVANERFTLLTMHGGKWMDEFQVSILNDDIN